MAALAVLAVSACVPDDAPNATPVDVSGSAHVIDGDTLDLDGTRIRLFAIDAPELSQSCSDAAGRTWDCGTWSKAVLKSLTTSETICEARDIDRYGRTVAVCTSGGIDVGRALVREGAAFAYTRYSTIYAKDENNARAEALGVWQGDAQRPDVVRAQARDLAKGAAPSTSNPSECVIKGNISQSGRIYHLPGSRSYDKTRISTRHGERWFCSEAEARAAGWRGING
ncbi:thermonuclease family protein [Celeribacter arenosi]|uniref:Thermonuclease family protein n=1 Tax=Celeribacter arenosi TaxID=792649 RepID=A0ABP7JSJ4_9RHOB